MGNFANRCSITKNLCWCHKVVWRKLLHLCSNTKCKIYISVVQLQACGLHVACHSVFSSPPNHSGKSSNLKLVEKCVRLHLSHWIACTGLSAFEQEQWLLSFLCTILLYLLCDQIRRYGLQLSLCWDAWLDYLCFFGALCSLHWNSTSGAINSITTNKSVYLSTKRSHLKVAHEPT